MRRYVYILVCCLLMTGAFFIPACSAVPTPATSEEASVSVTLSPVPATPAPTATPVPDPVIYLYGEEDTWFPDCCYDAVRDTYKAETVVSFTQVDAYPGDKVLVVYGKEPGKAGLVNDALSAGVPVIFVSLPFDSIAGNVNIRMDLPKVSDTIEAAIAFPPHDTPVRMFGLFSSMEGTAYSVWSEYTAAGKIFSKGVYEASTEEYDTDAWLTKKLSSYYPGMIDCIFAETAADALAAAEVLEREGRDDMEIFCAEYSDALYAKMLSAPEVVCGIASADAETALKAAMTTAEEILSGAANTETDRYIPACILSQSVNMIS